MRLSVLHISTCLGLDLNQGPDLLWFFPGAQPVCLGHYLAPIVHTRSRLGVPNLHARAQRQPALEASNTKTARFGARTLRPLLPEVCRSGHAQEVRNKPHFRSRSRILVSERSVCADGRGGRHEAAKHGRSKPRNQRWIDFLRSTGVSPSSRRFPPPAPACQCFPSY